MGPDADESARIDSFAEKQGWVEMRSKGSHRHFKHPNQAYVVTVPGNGGMELAPVL